MKAKRPYKISVWYNDHLTIDLAKNQAAFVAKLPPWELIAEADKYAQLFETAPEILAFLEMIIREVKPQHRYYKLSAKLIKKATR